MEPFGTIGFRLQLSFDHEEEAAVVSRYAELYSKKTNSWMERIFLGLLGISSAWCSPQGKRRRS